MAAGRGKPGGPRTPLLPERQSQLCSQPGLMGGGAKPKGLARAPSARATGLSRPIYHPILPGIKWTRLSDKVPLGLVTWRDRIWDLELITARDRSHPQLGSAGLGLH